MPRERFDAIVVGSGITGGWAAKELTERGLKTLMIERGRGIVHGRDYTTEGQPPYNFRFHMLGDQRRTLTDQPVQSRCAFMSEATAHFFVNDRRNPYSHPDDKPFTWIRGHQLGGRSLTWGRQSYRMAPLNFEENARDGYGTDWPIRYDDLAPWYSYVERHIGVSGENIGSTTSPDGEFQRAMPMNPAEQEFAARLTAAFPDRRATVARLANLTEVLGSRAPCQMRNACARGCSWGGYFSTLSSTLPAAAATGRLTVLTDNIVHSVIHSSKTSRATGVRVIDAKTKEMREYDARVIFLCASAFESVRILFNSATREHPSGLGNSSAVLGKYIMDHHASDLGVAEVDGPALPYFSGARPGPLLIPRFQNVDKPRADYVRGYQMHAGATPADWNRALDEGGVGRSLKARLRTPGPWSIILIAQGETLPKADNFLSLDPDLKDAWGMPALKINMSYGENERAMQKEATAAIADIFEAVGYKKYQIIPIHGRPGEAIHENGGARMGKDPKTSVLNAFNQLHDVPNLFVTDGAAMASSSSANPSLTYMALTARACAHAVDELKRRNI